MDKQTKSIIVQWIGPFVVMVMVLAVMLFNFSVKSKTNASELVTKNMTAAVETSMNRIKTRVTLLETVGKPIGELLGKVSSLESSQAQELAETAMKHSGAYMVCICDETGNGIDNAGEKISIVQTDYFEALYEAEEIRYVFTMNDGIQEQNAIIVSIPVENKAQPGRLLLFYPLNNFEAVVRQGDAISWSSVSLMDANGTILIASGARKNWQPGDNLFDSFGKDNSDNIKRIKNRINGNLSGMTSFTINGAAYTLVYVPLGINDWTLVTSIEQDYVDRLVSSQWKNVRNMLYQLIITMVVFAVVVVCVNIISKMYNVRKEKQLEEKADTDLLTGLNNKLATERKIKEFMARNPDSQSMMFILDIDNFKKINDTMGHAFGDEVLRSLGKQIGTIFRTSDIIGRAGGDEFIIFLKNMTDIESIRKEAKKVEDFFKDFKAGEYTKYSATASIGVAIFPKEGSDFESLYKAADQALYKAKKRGKNQLAFYDDAWKPTE